MSWFVLILAGLLEIVWALGLAFTRGFTRPLPSLITVAALASSIWLLALATRTLPLGTAYAVWVGIGVLGTTLGGMLLLGEPASLGRLLLLGLLIVAIVGLKLTAPA
jgi:quaternary ammonium compound-resistance protein SugE